MSVAGTAPTARVQIQVLDSNGGTLAPKGRVIWAQFNPTSLQYTITNTAETGSTKQKSRKVDDSTGKLTMDLVFDTTDSGDDVRKHTQQIAVLMHPDTHRKLTPIVQVSWGGIFKFKGVLDTYRETIDFFSTDGMPLRASVSVGFTTVTENNTTPKEVFAFSSDHAKVSVTGFFQASSDDSFELPVGDDDSPSSIASAVGDPGRARDIAAANGIEDLRNGSDAGDILQVDDDVPLDPPIAFASGDASASAGFGFGAGASAGFSAGASFGASAGAGFGASAGAGVSFGASANAGASFGASAGVTAGVSAGFGASASAGVSFGASASASASFGASAGASASFDASASFEASASASASGTFVSSSSSSSSASFSARAGSTASAHVPASEGAFARLRPPAPASRRQIDITQVFRAAASPQLTTDSPQAFGPGGQVVRVGASSTGADVGASISLRDHIEFED